MDRLAVAEKKSVGGVGTMVLVGLWSRNKVVAGRLANPHFRVGFGQRTDMLSNFETQNQSGVLFDGRWVDGKFGRESIFSKCLMETREEACRDRRVRLS